MKNYFFFGKHIHEVLLSSIFEFKEKTKKIQDLPFDERETPSISAYNTYRNVEQASEKIQKSHVFIISDSIKKSLMLTKVDTEDLLKIKLPFDIIFLDVSFTIDEMKKFCFNMEVKGMLDVEVEKFYGLLIYKSKCVCDQDNVYIQIFTETKNKMGLLTIDMLHVPMNKSFFYFFLLNFLNFINDPRVSYSEKYPDEKRNIRRKKQSKTLFPVLNIINISGELKKYFRRFSQIVDVTNDKHYTHQFWVRGHWRLLQAERYKKNIGKRFWIAPFIKGEGVLINKKYNVK